LARRQCGAKFQEGSSTHRFQRLFSRCDSRDILCRSSGRNPMEKQARMEWFMRISDSSPNSAWVAFVSQQRNRSLQTVLNRLV
jgi:hypothetical protein